MGLHRISRVYLADDSGLRSLGSSSRMGSEAMKAASEIAAAANSAGKGSYSVLPAVVTAGWVNERRMGAVVREVRPDWRDTRDAVLLKVLGSMGRRGR